VPIEVFDFRTDIRNVFIAPTMRGRFLRHEPGEIGPFHSHDVADELFLILQGQCEFTIEGEKAVLSPGQICFARAGEKHEVRVIGDEPMTMFLVVAPHLEPTHTFWDELGNRLPERYNMTTQAEYAAAGHTEPVASLAQSATAALTELASDTAAAAAELAAKAATLGTGGSNAKAALDEAWSSIRAMHQQLLYFQQAWNNLAQRIFEESGVDVR
jgi:quercetin dioxygenase-like cupin family protein